MFTTHFLEDYTLKEPIIAGLDVGSASVKTIIARINNDTLDVIGIGESESAGIRRGVIVNIDAATDAIEKSINKAETMAGIQLPDIITSVGGEHIVGINSKGVIGVNSNTKEVTKNEIDRVLESAKNVYLPSEREIIEAIEQEYSLDGQDEIKNPIGMTGTRLEADVHLITGSKTVNDNLKKCLQKLKFSGRDFITNIRGSAKATLTNDEIDLGVVIADIGHSTTSLIVYIEGAIWHTAVIPIGGQHITNDIASGLRVTALTAENLKRDHGYAYIDMVGEKDIIDIPTANGQIRTIGKRVLTEIIQPRVEEIFSLCNREIKKTNCADLISSGIVFTGGSAKLPGIVELYDAYQSSIEGGIPASARIGYPENITGITDIAHDTSFSAVVGILQMSIDEPMHISTRRGSSKPEGLKLKNIFKKNPFSELFH